MAKKGGGNLTEFCERCGSKEFAIEHKTDKRFCAKCRHVWLAMDKKDLMILALKKDLAFKQNEITNLQHKLAKLKVCEDVEVEA